MCSSMTHLIKPARAASTFSTFQLLLLCIFNWGFCANQQQTHAYMATAHLAVADAVDHLVVFAVEGVCQEAQALQQNRDVTEWFTAGSQSPCDDSAAQGESSPSASAFSPLWPAPSHDRPGSLCRLSRSRCSRWGWWHFRKWCWRSGRRWTWRWTGSPSSCWATAARSGIWWRGLDLRHPVSPSAAAGGGSSPPGWTTRVHSGHLWWVGGSKASN